MVLIASAVCLSAAGSQESAPEKSITVFIAASTTDVISDIARSFTDETGIAVNINPASSGTLAKQIEQGAPADIYISASLSWMQYVEELGLTSASSPFLKNRLVLIAPLDSPLETIDIDASLDFPSVFSGMISMGDPAHVPAGKYAAESLAYYGWDKALENRILPGADVRAALSVVELGETELGIVYETDAKKSSQVKIVGSFPEVSHKSIVYACAVLTESSEEGKDLYTYLLESETAKKLYTAYGFTY